MKAGFVSLIGRPNAGKSTLLNRLVGAKVAIVSDKPQTTRTRILGVSHRAGDPDPARRGQIVFVDTPGIHRPMHRLNVRMVDQAVDTIGWVDLLVVVHDAATRTGAGDRFVLELLDRAEAPVILALNKIDRIAKPTLLPLIDWFRRQREFDAIVPISALTGDGVDGLEKLLWERLPEGEPLYPDDMVTDQPERVIVAETVREKLLRHTRAELPFSTAVLVDGFEEVSAEAAGEAGADDRAGDAGGLLRLYCSIVVDRTTHKPIVLGRRGARIKQIGTEARHELERFFGTRVFLDLHVRVRTGWRENDRILRELGLER
ncbi:MAG: GTPase Era [Acidobacteria bacterium]|nr:GTPase Era [Acidobacteriota bacterium]MYD70693.1 GTPase Era [Acidobacteriota bacterium]MYJ03311.1 GTPase Era [Acidobacteriota bacterium]